MSDRHPRAGEGQTIRLQSTSRRGLSDGVAFVPIVMTIATVVITNVVVAIVIGIANIAIIMMSIVFLIAMIVLVIVIIVFMAAAPLSTV